jgi:hypothetical protein
MKKYKVETRENQYTFECNSMLISEGNLWLMVDDNSPVAVFPSGHWTSVHLVNEVING